MYTFSLRFFSIEDLIAVSKNLTAHSQVRIFSGITSTLNKINVHKNIDIVMQETLFHSDLRILGDSILNSLFPHVLLSCPNQQLIIWRSYQSYLLDRLLCCSFRAFTFPLTHGVRLVLQNVFCAFILKVCTLVVFVDELKPLSIILLNYLALFHLNNFDIAGYIPNHGFYGLSVSYK